MLWTTWSPICTVVCARKRRIWSDSLR
jgi:hypothetical protein